MNGGDNDAAILVVELASEHSGSGVGVGCALLEAVILLHSLIVEVFAIDHKEHLVDFLHARCQASRLERSERFSRTGGVPNVATALTLAPIALVACGAYALNDALRSGNLVRAHHHQHFLGGEHAVFGEHIQQRVLGEKRLCEVDEVAYGLIVEQCPV